MTSVQLGVLELLMKMDSNGKTYVFESIPCNTGALRALRTLVDLEFRLVNQKTYLRIS